MTIKDKEFEDKLNEAMKLLLEIFGEDCQILFAIHIDNRTLVATDCYCPMCMIEAINESARAQGIKHLPDAPNHPDVKEIVH